MVSSATASAFLPGVVATAIPRSVAAGTSTLTGPPRAHAHEPQVRIGVQHHIGHRRRLDDEHVMAVERGDHLARGAQVLAQPTFGGAGRDPRGIIGNVEERHLV